MHCHPSCVNLAFNAKLCLPSFQVVDRIFVVRGLPNERKHRFVHYPPWPSHGSVEVQEQHDPLLVSIVEYFVAIGVIESDDATFCPAKALIRYAHIALVSRLGYDQTEVGSDNALCYTSMLPDVKTRREYGKECCLESWYGFQQARCLGTTCAVVIDPGAKTIKTKSTPMLARGDFVLVWGDYVKGWYTFAIYENFV